MPDQATRRAHAEATIADPRWLAVLARDPGADGTFVYSVASTNVFCRPSCASRQARPENVRFHASAAAAQAAGFRPCQRCHPDQPSLPQQHTAMVATLCRTIEQAAEQADVPPSLRALAASVHLSPFHLQRIFRAVTGLSPKQYALAHCANTVRHKLRSTHTVTEAIYDAGYNASSRFYETSTQVLGMTPTIFRSGGKDELIRFATAETTLGSLLVAQSERGICAILLGDHPESLVRDLEARFPKANLIAEDSSLSSRLAAVVSLIETPSLGLDLPLDIRGTVFQQRVWHALRQLPAGTTASYTEIATRIGSPRAVRAVAGACAANALAVAIPCHRVVRGDGQLSGYRWGVERKRTLLDREAR